MADEENKPKVKLIKKKSDAPQAPVQEQAPVLSKPAQEQTAAGSSPAKVVVHKQGGAVAPEKKKKVVVVKKPAAAPRPVKSDTPKEAKSTLTCSLVSMSRAMRWSAQAK